MRKDLTRLLALLMTLVMVIMASLALPLLLTASLTVFLAATAFGVYRMHMGQSDMAFKVRGRPEFGANTVIDGQNVKWEAGRFWACEYPTGFRLCPLNMLWVPGSYAEQVLSAVRRSGASRRNVEHETSAYAFNARDQSSSVSRCREREGWLVAA